MKKLLSVAFVLIIYSNLALSQIILDENYSDWDSVSIWYDDTPDDVPGEISLGNFKAFGNSDFIFFYLEVGKEINLQDNNSVTMYIDTDNNSLTGKSINGIGAEVEFIFGQRQGTFYYDNSSTFIKHINLGLVSSPTVSSDRFEFDMDRTSIINGRKVFTGDTLKIAFVIPGGDVLPNESGGVEVVLSNAAYSAPQYSLMKNAQSNLRIMTFNVRRDDLFDNSRKESFRNLIKAIDPDIVGFQEIYNHTSAQTAALVNEFIPGEWYNSNTGSDNILVSRFPVINSYAIDGNSAFLLDLNQLESGRQMLFISAHTPCCDNNDSRQREIDNIMSFVRDAKDGSGSFTLPAQSPIVIVGDMNLVGFARQQYTFYSGDILNENLYGSDFAPDWDGSFFDDVKQITTGMPETFTWYSESSSFSPGRLDYIIYSGSVMTLKNSFALFTPAVNPDTLSAYNLLAADSKSASDHIPAAADFQLKLLDDVKETKVPPSEYNLFQNYPNPFNPSTAIKYELPESGNVKLIIYDMLGREIKTLVNGFKRKGRYEVQFNAAGLPSGIYVYKIETSNFSANRKMLLLK